MLRPPKLVHSIDTLQAVARTMAPERSAHGDDTITGRRADHRAGHRRRSRCGVGLYGVVAFAAGQRQGESGLRMALGATRGQIGALIAYGAMRAVLLGVVLGGVTCYALFQGIARFLYGMNPVDPVMFGMVAVCVALLSITASYLPARRASRLDPMEALRSE